MFVSTRRAQPFEVADTPNSTGRRDGRFRPRGAENRFAHELLHGDTGEPFESIEYAFREHGEVVRDEDDEQPWNPAVPLSGAEARVEAGATTAPSTR